MDETVINKFLNTVTKNAIPSNQLFECPSCSGYSFWDGEIKITRVKCSYCPQSFCLKCLKKWETHGKMCNEDLDQKKFLKVCGVLQYQKCPGCGNMVERIEGCFHMKCPCGTHFCYNCSTKLTTDGRKELGDLKTVHFANGVFKTCINGTKAAFTVPTDVTVDIKLPIPSNPKNTTRRQIPPVRDQGYPLFWRLNIFYSWIYCPVLGLLMHIYVWRRPIPWLFTVMTTLVTLLLMGVDKANLLYYLSSALFMFVL